MTAAVARIEAQLFESAAGNDTFQQVGPLDAAKFERMMASIQEEGAAVSLVNKPDDAGLGSMMKAAIDGVSSVNRNYKGMLEDSLKTLSSIDATDPRAMVVALETAVQMSVVEVQMQFAIKCAGSSKESLNTLLRTQG
jgi:hypothetical protein